MSTDILKAFLARLDVLGITLDLPIAWPGLPKEPPSTGMWLETRFFPNEPGDLTWDNTAQTDAIGFFQIMVCYRPGTNTGQTSQIAASEVADQIIAYFPKGLPLYVVRVRKTPWQSPAIDMEGKSFIPITISYRGIVSVPGYA